ncbi:hypothetical protein N341_12912, partial [Tyto alba]
AAIDFLLLAHGHGCEEFEGMCCMNLTGPGESLHRKLQQLKDGLHALKKADGLDGWLASL